MPLRRNGYSRKSSRLRYRMATGGGMSARRINWVAVLGTAGVLCALIVGIVFLVRGVVIDKDVDASLLASQTTDTPTQTTPPPSAQPTLLLDGSSEARALDMSQDATLVVSAEKNINRPAIYGDELVYSAGTGPLNEPMLTKLYLFNLKEMNETQITKVTVKNGEIYETYVNTDYIVWLDTDQQGTNKLYYIRRNDTGVADGEMPVIDEEAMGEATDITPGTRTNATPSNATPTGATPSSQDDESPERQIKESGYYMPMLRLSGDRLIWNEQDSEKTETLYMVDLITEENVALPAYTESIEDYEQTYAVSAPDIHGSEVIWSAPDRSDPDGKNSVIYTCNVDRLALEEDYQPDVWKADMYVHDPLTNGRAWAWIDTNHEPITGLYIKYGDEVKLVTESTLEAPLTNYCLGDDMLVYAKGGHIWVYFYESETYGRVTVDGETGKQPVTYGRRVVWSTDAEEGKDQLKVVYIP